MSQFLQDYDKLKFLGKGSFAKIYKVRHREFGYIRAIKVLDEEISEDDDKVYKTFVKECSLLLRLGNGCHPNIVRIYQPRKIEERALVEMDCIEGTTLEKYVSEKKFVELEEVFKFVREIGSALAYCHVDCYKYMMDATEKSDSVDALVKKYGVAHNDLHSNNIMRRDLDGSYVLLDFGLAIQDEKAVKSSSRRDGAAEYMAPEKWSGQTIENEKAVDIYGFGVLLYQMLAGRVPFVLDPKMFNTDSLRALNQIRKNHEQSMPEPIRPLREAAFKQVCPSEEYVQDYPDWLEKMIFRCLEKDPRNRFQNGKEMMDFFEQMMKQSEDNKEEKIALLESAIRTLQKEKVSLEEAVAFWRRESDSLKKESDSSKEENGSLKENNNELSRQINALNEENTQLKDSIGKLEEALRKLKRSGDGRASRAYKIWGWAASVLLLLSLGYSLARNHFDSSNYNRYSENYEAEEAVEEVVDVAPEYDYKAELDASNAKIKSLNESLSQKNDEISGLQKEVDEKNNEISALKAADLSQKVATQEREINRLKAANKDLSNKNKELTDQVNRFIQLMN